MGVIHKDKDVCPKVGGDNTPPRFTIEDNFYVGARGSVASKKLLGDYTPPLILPTLMQYFKPSFNAYAKCLCILPVYGRVS